MVTSLFLTVIIAILDWAPFSELYLIGCLVRTKIYKPCIASTQVQYLFAVFLLLFRTVSDWFPGPYKCLQTIHPALYLHRFNPSLFLLLNLSTLWKHQMEANFLQASNQNYPSTYNPHLPPLVFVNRINICILVSFRFFYTKILYLKYLQLK